MPAKLYFPRITEVTSSWPSLPISVWTAKNVLCLLTHRLGSVFYCGGAAKSAGSCQDYTSQRCKWGCVGLRGKAAETISFLHPHNILCFAILKKFLKLIIKIFLRGWPQNDQKMWIRNLRISIQINGLPGGMSVKILPANAEDIRDSGSIPELGRSLGGGKVNPLQYSCLEHPEERGA